MRERGEAGDVAFVERIAGRHLPEARESNGHGVGRAVELDRGHAIDRAGSDIEAVIHDVRGLVEGGVRVDGAIEIAPGMIGVAYGEEKQVERPSRAGRIFGQDLLNLRARNQRAGRIVDGAELVDSAFTDRDLIRYIDGLI